MAVIQKPTYDALKTQVNPSTDRVVVVQGNTAENDGGQGIFEWDSNSALPDNAGTVLTSSFFPPPANGRWIRQVDVRGPFHAEWFGAKGDGVNDDATAIQNCIKWFGRVTLRAKRYLINSTIVLHPGDGVLTNNQIFEGQGIDQTFLLLRLPNGTAAAPAIWHGAWDDLVNNAVVRELTIDCGFNESNRTKTRKAVELRGDGNRVERVKAINFGAGTDSGSPECFVIAVTSAYLPLLDSVPRMGTIRGCVVTEPGRHASDLSLPEITCLSMASNTDTDGLLGEGGAIVGNRVIDIPWDRTTQDSTQPSEPHAITVGNCRGTLIADNEVINCDGTGIYIVSWKDLNTVIRGNRLIGVNTGVQIAALADQIPASPPHHEGTQVTDNVIVLGRTSARAADFRGIYLGTTEGLDGVRLLNIQVARNYVRGSKVTVPGQGDCYPYGVQLNLNTATAHQGLVVEQNILETPDADVRSVEHGGQSYPYGFSQPFENALVLYPVYSPVLAAQITPHGNRTLSGQPVRLKMARWDYEDPVWHPPLRGWGPYSARYERCARPSYDGRVGVFYDEFLGELPRSALGWAGEKFGFAAAIAPVDSDAEHPGIVKLSTGTNIAGYAALKYAPGSVRLGGGLAHVLQFSAFRLQDSTYPPEYECILGLLASLSSKVGIYFRVTSFVGDPFMNNKWYAVCTDSEEEQVVAVTTASDTGEGGRKWREFRIEISGDASVVDFFFDKNWLGRATTYIPSGGLTFVMMVRNRSQPYWGLNHDMVIDYFSHGVR